MFYIHYDDEGSILSVANSKDETLKSIETDLETYNDFSSLKKQVHEYKVVEDILIKGKMHLVSMVYNDSDEIVQHKGPIPLQKKSREGINFIQQKNNWKITCKLKSDLVSAIAAGGDSYRQYYVVDKGNRYLLLDTLNVNLKELVLEKNVKIKKEYKYKDVLVLSNNSPIQHTHIAEK